MNRLETEMHAMFTTENASTNIVYHEMNIP